MKKTLSVIVLMLMVACATNKTFTTLSATEQAVTIGYSAYLDLVVAGKVPTNNVPTIARAYDDFQAAMKAAVLFSQTTNAPVTQTVIEAATTILRNIAKEEWK